MGQLATNPDPAVDDAGTPPADPPAAPEPTRAEQMAADLTDLTADAPVEPDAGDPPAPADPPAPDPADPPADDYFQIGTMQIPRDQEDAVIGLLEWASSLTEEQAELAFKAAAGNLPGAVDAAGTPPAPAAEPDPIIPAELAETYPEVAEALRRQHEQIEALRAEIDPRLNTVEDIASRQAYDSTQQQINDTETRVRDEFLKAKSLTDDDYPALVRKVGELGIVPALVESLGLEAGFTRALEVAYASDPDMLKREAQRIVQTQQTASRKERAAALSPSGGSLPRTAPDPAGLPVDARRRAMVDDINNIIGQES
jgi:hypothetical protein